MAHSRSRLRDDTKEKFQHRYKNNNSYISVSRKPQKPEQECCVRAYAQRTYWKMEALPNGQTKVVVEVQTDPKGALPSMVDQHDSKGLALQLHHQSHKTSTT